MIDYLVIGAITRDLLPGGGATPGGTVRYTARAALRLGLRPAIVTCCDPSFDPELPPELPLLRAPAPATMTFENRYAGSERQQWLHASPPPLDLAAVPAGWRHASIVHLAPLGAELPEAALGYGWAGLCVVTPQGWLRAPDHAGRVFPRRWQPDPALLRRVAALVLSEEDLGGSDQLARAYASCGPIVALTRAERGATLFLSDGTTLDIPALPARPVDPTGAGDVFSAAFIIALREGRPAPEAARWACAAAACSIEGAGTSALPDRAAVEARLAQAR
jgi:hypothetical protein